MSDGVIDRSEERGTFERVTLKLNYYGLVQSLTKAGHVPDGFNIECAYFDDTVLEVTMRRETREPSAPPDDPVMTVIRVPTP